MNDLTFSMTSLAELFGSLNYVKYNFDKTIHNKN